MFFLDNLSVNKSIKASLLKGVLAAALVYSTPSFSQVEVPRTWQQLGSDIAGELAFDQSGFSVSLSGDGSLLAIGAPGNDSSVGSDAGHVRIYQLQSGQWVQLGADINGLDFLDQSGWSVAISEAGNRVAIGAPYTFDNGALGGQIRVFEFTTSGWQPVGTTITGDPNAASGGYDFAGIGWSVSLSGDGSRVAFGAPIVDSGGYSQSFVRVYEFNQGSSEWQLIGGAITADANRTSLNDGDQTGFSVDLSRSGDTVAVGEPGFELGRGRVRVFQLVNGLWSERAEVRGATVGSQLGESLALSANGNRVVIGAPGSGSIPGAVSVYELPTAGGAELAGQTLTSAVADDGFGQSVSIGNDEGSDYIAIGANLASGDVADSGEVTAYQLIDVNNTISTADDQWQMVGAPLSGVAAGDKFGTSVSLSNSGLRLAVGASEFDSASGTDSGVVRVFEAVVDDTVVPTPPLTPKVRAVEVLGNQLQGFVARVNLSAPLNGQPPVTEYTLSCDGDQQATSTFTAGAAEQTVTLALNDLNSPVECFVSASNQDGVSPTPSEDIALRYSDLDAFNNILIRDPTARVVQPPAEGDPENTPNTTDTVTAIQLVYVALLGRPADRAGLDFWFREIQSGRLDLDKLRASFTESEEYKTGLGLLPAEQLVQAFYQNLFNREALGSGNDRETEVGFWVGELQAGEVTADTLSIALINGATNGTSDQDPQDLEILSNIATAALLYTNVYDTFNAPVAASITAIIDGIDASPESLQIAIDLINANHRPELP